MHFTIECHHISCQIPYHHLNCYPHSMQKGSKLLNAPKTSLALFWCSRKLLRLLPFLETFLFYPCLPRDDETQSNNPIFYLSFTICHFNILQFSITIHFTGPEHNANSHVLYKFQPWYSSIDPWLRLRWWICVELVQQYDNSFWIAVYILHTRDSSISIILIVPEMKHHCRADMLFRNWFQS